MITVVTFENLSLSAAEAQHLALYAQGFGAFNGGSDEHSFGASVATPAPIASPKTGSARPPFDPLERTIQRLGLLQIDSINVFARSHYVPVFSRAGSFDLNHFDDAVFAQAEQDIGARFFEYRSHELAIHPAEDFPLWRWRMDRYRARQHDGESWAALNPKVLNRVKQELAERGPLTAAELGRKGSTKPADIPYWSTMRTEEKHALEVLFHSGQVVSAGRAKFQRRYGLPEQILSDTVLNLPIPSETEAIRELVLRSVRYLGIGTLADITDYFRLWRMAPVREALDVLSEAGSIVPALIPEWGKGDENVWIDSELLQHPDLANIFAPDHGQGSGALLSPFDPVVWYRPRAERIFGFNYRIEIYVPEPRRQYGYYCLPVLLDNRIVGRFDLKAERKTRTLEVRASWSEENIRAGDDSRIAALIQQAAEWQGLENIRLHERGNFHLELSRVLKTE